MTKPHRPTSRHWKKGLILAVSAAAATLLAQVVHALSRELVLSVSAAFVLACAFTFAGLDLFQSWIADTVRHDEAEGPRAGDPGRS